MICLLTCYVRFVAAVSYTHLSASANTDGSDTCTIDKIAWPDEVDRCADILHITFRSGYMTRLPAAFAIIGKIERKGYKTCLLYTSTSSARVMTSVSLFQSDMTSVLMDSFFSRSKTLSLSLIHIYSFNHKVVICCGKKAKSQLEKLIPVSYTHLDVYKRQ